MTLTDSQALALNHVAKKHNLTDDDLEVFKKLVDLNHDISPEADREFDGLIDDERACPAMVVKAFTKYQEIWIQHVVTRAPMQSLLS